MTDNLEHKLAMANLNVRLAKGKVDYIEAMGLTHHPEANGVYVNFINACDHQAELYSTMNDETPNL